MVKIAFTTHLASFPGLEKSEADSTTAGVEGGEAVVTASENVYPGEDIDLGDGEELGPLPDHPTSDSASASTPDLLSSDEDESDGPILSCYSL